MRGNNPKRKKKGKRELENRRGRSRGPDRKSLQKQHQVGNFGGLGKKGKRKNKEKKGEKKGWPEGTSSKTGHTGRGSGPRPIKK